MLNLRLQVFLALLGFAASLLLAVFWYSRTSFESNFESYILQRENARNAELIEALKRHYEAEGSFNYFVARPHAWEVFIRQPRSIDSRDVNSRDVDSREIDSPSADPRALDARDTNTAAPERRAQASSSLPSAREMRRDLRREGRSRLVLLDANKQDLAGARSPREQYVYTEIRLDGPPNKALAGYLAIAVNPFLRDLADTQFVDQERSRLSRMLVLALVFAFAFAIPLAFFFTRKIALISAQVQRLSAGDYREPLRMTGSAEFARLAEGLNHLGATLAASELSRKRWVADISHELRTPLAVLKADLEAVSDGIRPFNQDTVARLQHHTQRLQHLVNDLYQLSLTDLGAMQYRKAPTDLRELTQTVAANLTPSFNARGLALELQLPEAPVALFADAERLQQLLLNLLHNALHYTDAPGQLQIKLWSDTKHAHLWLDDSAPGVAPDELEKIFHRLYRADHSRSRDTGGAGLGLSICQNIIEAHGGQLHAEASPLGGLGIRISLPLTQGAN